MFGNPKRKRAAVKAPAKYRIPSKRQEQPSRNTSHATYNVTPVPLYSVSPPYQDCPASLALRIPPSQTCPQPSLAVPFPVPPNPGTSGRSSAQGQLCSNITRAITAPLQTTRDGIGLLQHKSTDYIHQGTAVCDLIASKFDAVITSIDGEIFSGDERELAIYQNPEPTIRGGWGLTSREVSRTANNAISSAVTSPKSTNYFVKADLYANSRLRPNLPTLKLYLPSYPLLCLAAQYSQRVYMKPIGKEREAHVDADWRMGTKAMVMKSVPIDDMNTVVFAIRGSQTFMDWAVNLKSAPSAPVDFLDDYGNLCHSGFLSVARKMIKPVAARLRSLLEENPARSSFSLLMTGHSAGGAVASLLYAHMLAEDVKSELNILTGCFKRIHCITFGAPPISLLPLQKPATQRLKKSLFLSFINEGDPVPRADRAYVRSLLALYASPAPGATCLASLIPVKSAPKFPLIPSGRPKPQKVSSVPYIPAPVWNVPPGALSNAGRLVVLRKSPNGLEDDVKAEVTCDAELRGVIFGNPMMHMMNVYARRVEILATKAVTAKIWA